MTKTKKAQVIEQLTNEFKTATAVVVCDYRGSTVSDLETLRIAAREKDVKVQVAKNTLATIALKNCELEGISLVDTNIFIWGEDAISASKIASEFATSNKDNFSIRSAYIDGEASDAAKVQAFAKLPGREELLGMLAATWMAPVANFTIGLDALRQQKEEA